MTTIRWTISSLAENAREIFRTKTKSLIFKLKYIFISHPSIKAVFIFAITGIILAAFIGIQPYEIRAIGLIGVIELLALLILTIATGLLGLTKEQSGHFGIGLHICVGMAALATYMGQI